MLRAGVIEGFYGPPWSDAERRELFGQMAAWGLDTYMYCPKDDLHHRLIWREPYPADEAHALAGLIRACQEQGLQCIYGIGPGLDIRYSREDDRLRLQARVAQLLGMGCSRVALLFDDIPDRLDPADVAAWGSLAAAQSDVANTLFTWLRGQRADASLVFCPTPYCGRMAAAGLGGPGYLETIGRLLAPGIDVCWTGPEIVSCEIPLAHIRDVRRLLRRKPLLWDNLHANDYDGRRFVCGPYAGRPRALLDEVSGVLSNPNTESPLNVVPLRTLAAFVRGEGPWDARAAYLDAMRVWHAAFDTVSGPVDFDMLVRLGDCFYLPCDDGPHAQALLARARRALSDTSDDWRDDALACVAEVGALRDFCHRLATLRNRALFHALNRRVWDLREELDLLVRGIEARLRTGASQPFRSDFHLPGTYRGGLTARLQRLLVQHPDGTFTPAPTGDLEP